MRTGPMVLRLLLLGAAASACLAGWTTLSVRGNGIARTGSRAAEPPGPVQRQTRDDLMARSRSLLELSDFAGAISALDRVLELSTLDAEALALQVRAFRSRRQYGPARSAAGRILARHPHSPLAHLLIGSISVQEGDALAARNALEHALDLDTASALPAAQLASLDLMEGKVEDARLRATQSLALDPGSVTALRTLWRITRSVPALIDLSERMLMSNPEDELTRSWLEVLKHSGAPEVNYMAPVETDVVIACERTADGRLFTRADIHPFRNLRFLVDTGASGVVLSEKLARRMNLPLREFSWSTGVGGARRHSHPILLPRLELGGVRSREILATASDLPDGIDGIINPLIFTPAGSGLTLGLRPADSSLVVTRGRLTPASSGQPRSEGWITLPFLAEGPRVMFRIMIAGAPAMALLDTGAAADILDPIVLQRVPGGAAMRREPAGGQMLIGFGGSLQTAIVDGEIPIRIAGADIPADTIFAVELNNEPFRFEIDLDAVIGIGTLSRFDLVIDMSSGLIALRTRTY